MTDKISAPWTIEQVKALNRWQTCGHVHPYTCPNDHGENSRDLFATPHGWICLHCSYTQDWAWSGMFNGPPELPKGMRR